MKERKPYPRDVNDDEWSFLAPCLTIFAAFPFDSKQQNNTSGQTVTRGENTVCRVLSRFNTVRCRSVAPAMRGHATFLLHATLPQFDGTLPDGHLHTIRI